MISTWEAILWGLGGGVTAQFVAIADLAKVRRTEWPFWMTSLFYWAVATGFVLLGGLLSYLLTAGRDVNVYLAFHTGLAAPFVLEKLMKSTPSLSAGPVS